MWNPFKSTSKRKKPTKLNFIDYIYLIYFYATLPHYHKQLKDKFRYGYGYYITLSLESNTIDQGIMVKDLELAEPMDLKSIEESEFDALQQTFVPVPALVNPLIVRFLVMPGVELLPSVSQLRALMYTEWSRNNDNHDMSIPCVNMIAGDNYFTIYALIEFPGIFEEEDTFYRLMYERLKDYADRYYILVACIENKDFKTIKDYFETIGIYLTISDYTFKANWNPNPRY